MDPGFIISLSPAVPAAEKAVLRSWGKDVRETLHAASETGVDPVYATCSATGLYRTTPLRGAWQHPPYFHDGSAADFAAVVEHYDSYLDLGLSAEQKADLGEYLKSL